MELDRYIPRHSPAHHADARLKILLAAAAVLGIALLPVGAFVAYAIVWLVLVAASTFACLGPFRLVRGSWVVLPFVLVARSQHWSMRKTFLTTLISALFHVAVSLGLGLVAVFWTVLAVAGLTRLGRSDAIGQILPVKLVLPAVGQGALCIEVRAGDDAVLQIIAPLDHQPTRQATAAERAFLGGLDGSCETPIAGYGCTCLGLGFPWPIRAQRMARRSSMPRV